ncbi:uncharacterized protein TA10505 [Theileria annulata]|uniref:Uncharacterized protein n=1 Tax=Theileria annulata TaxID=5874 RepID=Q4U902_THEAN|nr:uncharacterized protein TA10505 [Theileria annulata]CAI76701.1 hypothetical protein TA10505 [Theileria annulata]|eukprot:XP_953326.1 hypothetical protein TA10505 [Theileria annulata]
MTGEQPPESNYSKTPKNEDKFMFSSKFVLALVAISINMLAEQTRALSSHFIVGLNIRQENVGVYISKMKTYRVIFMFLGFITKDINAFFLRYNKANLTIQALLLLAMSRGLTFYFSTNADNIGFAFYCSSNMDAFLCGMLYNSIISFAPQQMTIIRLSSDMCSVLVTIIQTILDVIFEGQSLLIIKVQCCFSFLLTLISLFLWFYQVKFLEIEPYKSTIVLISEINAIIYSFNHFLAIIDPHIAVINRYSELFSSYKKSETKLKSLFKKLEKLLEDIKELDGKTANNGSLESELRIVIEKLSLMDEFAKKLSKLLNIDLEERQTLRSIFDLSSEDFAYEKKRFENVIITPEIEEMYNETLKFVDQIYSEFKEFESIFETIEEIVESIKKHNISNKMKIYDSKKQFKWLLKKVAEILTSKSNVPDPGEKIKADDISLKIESFFKPLDRLMDKVGKTRIDKIQKKTMISPKEPFELEKHTHGYFRLWLIMKSPIIMFLLSTFLFEFLFPHVIPYWLLNGESAIVVSLVIAPFRISGSIAVFLTDYFVANFKNWTWQYDVFWILVIPQFMTFLISIIAIHTRLWPFTILIDQILLVVIVAVIMVICNSLVESFSYMAIANYVVNNRLHSRLLVIHTILIEVIRLTFMKIGVGYSDARNRYGLIYPDFEPHREIQYQLIFWIRETIYRADRNLWRDLSTRITRYTEVFEQ